MSRTANVASIEVLKIMRTELSRLSERLAGAIDEAENEVQRTQMWLQHDRYPHWQTELRVRTEQVSIAKSALNQKKLWDASPLNARSSYIDEKKALEAAKQRCLEAEQKLQRIRNGIMLLEREANLFKTHTRRLGQVLEIEIPNAKAKIDHMTEALENYVALAAETGSSAVEGRTEETTASFAVKDSVRHFAMVDVAADAISALRARSLEVADRQAVPQGESPPAWLVSLPAMPDSAPAQKWQATKIPLDARDIVIIAETESMPETYYLERLSKICQGDSGWYIAPADGTRVAGHVALPLGALREARPDWTDWLSLPPGFLVLCSAPQRLTIVNPGNQIV
jgi:hypothetical protein